MSVCCLHGVTSAESLHVFAVSRDDNGFRFVAVVSSGFNCLHGLSAPDSILARDNPGTICSYGLPSVIRCELDCSSQGIHLATNSRGGDVNILLWHGSLLYRLAFCGTSADLVVSSFLHGAFLGDHVGDVTCFSRLVVGSCGGLLAGRL